MPSKVHPWYDYMPGGGEFQGYGSRNDVGGRHSSRPNKDRGSLYEDRNKDSVSLTR